MPSVTPELTRKVARLARLELTDVEVETFTRQLGEILGYVESLAEVATPESVVPLLQPLDARAELVPVREDRVEVVRRGPDGRAAILEHAPETLHDGFKVPRIV